MLQQFGQHENHRFGVARHRGTSKLSRLGKPRNRTSAVNAFIVRMAKPGILAAF
jgi:hypothetical protein